MQFGVLITAAILLTTFHAGADWSQWRGAGRDGAVSGKKWPATLDKLVRKWSLPLNASYSGPVMNEKLVFTTESKERQYELAHAVDRNTGKIVWTAQWEGYQGVPFFAARNGDWIRSTPALTAESLYVCGMKDLLVSLDVRTGKEQWRLDFPADMKAKTQSFGFACSPLVEGDALYVHGGAGLCRLDRKTGKLIWRALDDGGGMNGGSFSSPVVATIGGKQQIISQGRTSVSGLDLQTGSQLWSQPIKAFRGMNIFTPVIKGNRLFTSAYDGVSQGWDLGKAEGGSFKVVMAWEHKAEGYMSTPLVISGKIFMHLRNKRFTCLDLATGAQDWVTDEKFGEYWSMVYQGSRILALDQRGILYYIQASPKRFELIGQQKVADTEAWAHLAVDDGMVVVRSLTALTAFDWAE